MKDTFQNDPLNLLYPLSEFYAEAGLALPSVLQLDVSNIPEPYRSLLVHDNDMTPTLERACGQSIHLMVLSRRLCGETLSRQVVLVLDGNEEPVEFGAIKIYLGLFPPEARQSILEGHRPLGSILNNLRLKHTSRPKAFLQVASDAHIINALKLTSSHLLFGRRNELVNSSQQSLAEIVEILPPSFRMGS